MYFRHGTFESLPKLYEKFQLVLFCDSLNEVQSKWVLRFMNSKGIYFDAVYKKDIVW